MNSKNTNIKHLAIIMDGNARWANKAGLLKAEGHKKGAENIKEILSCALEYNIPYLTLYAFSSENWQRENQEISTLMELLEFSLHQEAEHLAQNGIKLKIIGQINKLNPILKQEINRVVKLTELNNKITLCIAFSYGGRDEILYACQNAIDSGKAFITLEDFKSYLYDPKMPDVDLLIRTSGAYRISNFLLWQSAYAEFYFCKKNWPDFKKDDLIKAFKEYARRKRTFGTR